MIFYFMIFYGFPDIFNMMLNFHWISCPFPNDVFQMILAWIFDLEKQLPLYWLCYSREVNHLVISNMRLAILGHTRVTAVRRSEALRHASPDGQDTRLASRSRHASNESSNQQKQHGSSTEGLRQSCQVRFGPCADLPQPIWMSQLRLLRRTSSKQNPAMENPAV
jgi:hypothetical protein